MEKDKKTHFFSKTVGLIIPIFILAVWYVFSKNGVIKSNILPTPTSVVDAFIESIKSGELIDNIVVSSKRALIGLLIGGGIGFFLGLATGLSKIAKLFLNDSIQMIRNIPILALLPLIILWFGIGERAKIVMVALSVFFPIYLNTYSGIYTIDPGLIEMGKIYGLRGFSLFKHIIFPGALQSILVGLRHALGTMWLILIAAETVASDAGIGYMAMTARELLQMDIVVLSIIIYAVLGKLSDVVANVVERAVLRWNPAFNS
ncbi:MULTISPECIES: ABC transporter permease subunit [unclassified Clostridium]|uniref:ABC transporter permease subunit n=1 Tax=unclassified Clostridium TaxID=2614128 RepID=UPI000297C8F3|nr:MULTISPECIES: ABC transporter permease subunit [unclassified Clostridium]EKQ58120.1 MAG: ABC-type nitrate/sulfonate/bicarbonate transport system, permease component [Clostridium sp. Maddingley MBC34-26]